MSLIIKNGVEYAGSGGGIPYSATLLYDIENVFAANTTITLYDAWTNYDELRIYCYWKETAQTPNYYAHRAMMTITKETLTWSLSEFGQTGAYRGTCDLIGSYEQDGIYSAWGIYVTTTSSITCKSKFVGRWSANTCVIKEIYGIKYGSGGINSNAQKYSYLEHVIGYWVDGSPVYEKTIHIQPTGNTNDYVTAEAIQDVDVVIDNSFTAKRVQYGYTYYYTGTGAVMPESVSLNQYKIGIRVSSGNVQYYVSGYDTAITDIWATIKYTKTAS